VVAIAPEVAAVEVSAAAIVEVPIVVVAAAVEVSAAAIVEVPIVVVAAAVAEGKNSYNIIS
jgi:hypothetical protein